MSVNVFIEEGFSYCFISWIGSNERIVCLDAVVLCLRAMTTGVELYLHPHSQAEIVLIVGEDVSRNMHLHENMARTIQPY